MWREAVRWAFHSPRRLLAVTVVPLLVAVLLVGALSRDPVRSMHGTVPATAATLPATGAAVVTPPAAGAYLRAAADFTRAWVDVRRRDAEGAWHARVAPHVTPQLADGLRATDPTRVPRTAMAGPPVSRVGGDYSAEVTVPLRDGSSLLLELVHDGRRWVVADVQPWG
jgi:hypothetical protein